jgi:hypothetical protein
MFSIGRKSISGLVERSQRTKPHGHENRDRIIGAAANNLSFIASRKPAHCILRFDLFSRQKVSRRGSVVLFRSPEGYKGGSALAWQQIHGSKRGEGNLNNFPVAELRDDGIHFVEHGRGSREAFCNERARAEVGGKIGD